MNSCETRQQAMDRICSEVASMNQAELIAEALRMAAEAVLKSDFRHANSLIWSAQYLIGRQTIG